MKHKVMVVYPGDKTFELELESNETAEEICDQMYAWFNHGSGQECETLLETQNRSLSVNDFVIVDGESYQCQPVGWQKVTPEFVKEIVKEVEEMVPHYGPSAWHALHHVMFKRNNPRGA